jgi:hypothetical protein
MDLSQLTFVDAAALIAVLDRSVDDHHFIGELWRMEIDSGSTLITTESSVLKAALDLQARHGLAGIEALFRIVVPALRVEKCSRVDTDLAVAALLASGDAGRDLVQRVEERVKLRLRVAAGLSRL